MKRIVVVSLSVLLVFAVVGLACGHDCAQCSKKAAKSEIADRCVKGTYSTAALVTASGARWCLHTSACLVCGCHQAIRNGVTQVHHAVESATNRVEAAAAKITAEVTSLSQRVLRSALSFFLALISGLARS